MKCFLILAAIAALASAGYQYKVPQTSYGVPSYQHGSSANLGGQQSGHSALSGGNAYQLGYDTSGTAQTQFQTNGGYQNTGGFRVGPSTGYQVGGNTGYQNSGTGLGFQSGSSSSVQSGGNAGIQSSGFYQPAAQGVNYQSNNQYLEKSSGLSSYQQYYQQAQNQPAQVFKHFYVHAAPEEPETPKFRQPLILPAPQKHYKIIFIKTPSPPAAPPQYIPVQHQNEEKTIVYVLVKKPEEAGEIVIPKIAPKPPSKPEVYFIKYNSKEGSQGVINNIVSDINSNSGGASFSAQTVGAGANFADESSSSSATANSNLISGGSSSGGSFSTQQSDSGLTHGGSSGSLGLTGLSSGGSSSGGSFSTQLSDSGLTHGGSSGSLGLTGLSSGGSSSGGSFSTQLSDSGLTHGGSSGSLGLTGLSSGSFQTVSTGDNSLVHDQGSVSNELISQGGYASGQSQNLEGYQSAGTSQGLPHTSYGPPNFRS